MPRGRQAQRDVVAGVSWDFRMEPAPLKCGRCGHPVERPPDVSHYDANYTYNVSEMFYDALPCRDGIRGLNGATGAECRPLLLEAIRKMESEPAKYRAMNPRNGWGDYEGALTLLRQLYGWCEDSPEAVLVVS